MPSLLKQSPKSYQPLTPTSNPWMQMQYDIKNYKQHWHNVTHAKAKVDHSAPPLLPSFYDRNQQLAIDEKRLKQISRQNKQLVQKINFINRTTGKVDSHMGKYITSSNMEQRKIEARLIAKHNLSIIQRLLKVVLFTNINILLEMLTTRLAHAPLSVSSIDTFVHILTPMLDKSCQNVLTSRPNLVPTSELLADWKRIENIMEYMARFPLFWKQKLEEPDDDIRVNDHRWTIQNSSILTMGSVKRSIKKLRPRVFLDIATSHGEKLGRMIIELYNDVVPDSAENFRSLCQGDNPYGLTYQGNPFCRIIPGLYCQAGDITHQNGSGGMSIYGEKFSSENFHLSHGGPGVVTMHNTGPNTNNSQFMITFKALPTLNGTNVVIGKVIQGFHTLFRLEELGTATGKLLQKVYIKDCGEVVS